MYHWKKYNDFVKRFGWMRWVLDYFFTSKLGDKRRLGLVKLTWTFKQFLTDYKLQVLRFQIKSFHYGPDWFTILELILKYCSSTIYIFGFIFVLLDKQGHINELYLAVNGWCIAHRSCPSFKYTFFLTKRKWQRFMFNRYTGHFCILACIV